MAKESFKRKMSAVFSADVVGYSRLMGEDEAATVDTITSYRKIMADLVQQHRGRIVDTPGDNVLAEFASVVDAVQGAVAVQKEIQARNAALSHDRRMQFRIGVNLGDVIEEGESIYGDGVNIAARLEALADPGGICISKTAFDHIESKLPLGYEDIGEQVVKNIDRPVTAYKVLMDPRIISSRGVGRTRGMPPWLVRSAIAGGVSIAIMAMAFGIWSFYLGGRITERAPSGRGTIVVLPFRNLTGDPGQEHFSDGMTEQLIGTLAKVKGLKVISQTSAFYYKGKDLDLRAVGRELGVANVLEGSLRKSGNRLRITAQLINVADDTHLWTETYEREMSDAFGIQDEISQAVAKSLKTELLGIEDDRLVKDYIRRAGVDTTVSEGETVEGGLSAFGANIEIAGTVDGGIEAFGANMEVSGTNRGDLRFGGANVILSGEFHDAVVGMSANLTISGTFEDDLHVKAARIVIAPTAVIKGDLVYATPLLERKQGSRIMGQVIPLDSEEGRAWMRIRHPPKEGHGYLAKGLFGIVTTLALMIVGLLIHFCLPKQTEAVVTALGGSVWRNLGIGLLTLVAAPLCIVISISTALGIPAGIILAFLFITMAYVSRVYVVVWVGRQILGRLRGSSATLFFWPFVAGAVTIGILMLVPVIDWLLRLFLLLIGLGAMSQVMWRAAKAAREA